MDITFKQQTAYSDKCQNDDLRILEYSSYYITDLHEKHKELSRIIWCIFPVRSYSKNVSSLICTPVELGIDQVGNKTLCSVRTTVSINTGYNKFLPKKIK